MYYISFIEREKTNTMEQSDVYYQLLTSYKTAPHNRYQQHPAEPEHYTMCSNTVFVLLKMGIMMPETC